MSKSIKELKNQLNSNNEAHRLVTLSETLKYGQEGLDLLIEQSLNDKSERVRQLAYWVFRGDNSCLNENREKQNTACPTDAITSLAISSNDKILVGGSWQKIWVWNLEDGKVLYTIDSHFHWILSVAISPDGNILVSGSADKTVKIWNLKTGQLIHSLSHQSWVTAVAISPDGNTLVSGSTDKTIHIWNLATGKSTKIIKNKKELSSVLSLCISPDGETIASGSSDNKVALWNLKSGKFIRSLEGHSDWISSVKITSDNTTLISGSRDGVVKSWQSKAENGFNMSGLAKGGGGAALGFFVGNHFLLGVGGVIGACVGGTIGLLISSPNQQFPAGSLEFAREHIYRKAVSSLDFCLAKNILLIAYHNVIKVFELRNIDKTYNLLERDSFISSAMVNYSGKIFIFAGKDWVTLLNAQTGKPLHPIKGCSYPRLSKLILKSSNHLFYGESYTFTVKGLNQNGQEMKINAHDITWAATGGRIQQGLFIAGQVEGTFQVTAKVDIFEVSVPIKVIEPPKVTTLSVTPSNLTLKFGETRKLLAKVLDQRGNFMPENVLWEVNEGGTIDQNGNFIAGMTPGDFKITVSTNSIFRVISVTVIEPPKLTKIIITPSISQLEFGKSFQFQAQGIDQYGKNIQTGTVTWSASDGNISDSGKFYADYQEKIVTINATVGEINDWKEVRIYEPSRLTEIEVFPSFISLEPEQSTHFNINAFDQRGEEIDGDVFDIKWNATDGSIDQNGYFHSRKQQKGLCNVTATVENFRASAEVFVIPVLKEIKISPEEIELKPEEEFTFSVTALDQVGEPFPITYAVWTATTGGLITSRGVFSGNYKKREVTVTVNIENLSATAKVILLPVLRRLEIQPGFVYLKPGEQQKFLAKGFDQFGKPINTGDIYWETTGGKIDQEGTLIFENNEKGYFQVTATSQAIPKYSRNFKTLLLYTGVSTRIISYLISQDIVFQDLLSLFLNLSSVANIEPESKEESSNSIIHQEESEQKIDLDTKQDIDTAEVDIVEQPDADVDGEIEPLSESEAIVNADTLDFSEVLEQWLLRKLQKSIAQFFLFISRLCLSEASANLSASADVFVLDTTQNLYRNFKCLNVLDEHSEFVDTLAITPDGQLLVSGSWDNTIKIWNLHEGKRINTLKDHTSDVECVAVTPDAKTLVSGSWDNTIKIWDLETGKLQSSKSCLNPVVLVAITPDGKNFVSSETFETTILNLETQKSKKTWGFAISLWNLGTQELEKTWISYSLNNHPFWWHKCIVTLPKSRIMIVGKQTIKSYNLKNGKVKTIIGTNLGWVYALAITPDEKTLISGHDRIIKVWALTAKKYPIIRLELQSSAEHVCALVLTPDGKRLISASCERDHDDGRSFIEIWDLGTGEQLHSIEDQDHRKSKIYCLAITPDGSKIISGYTNGMIKIWGIPELTLD